MKTILAAAILAPLLLPRVADAGWYARQIDKSPDAAGAKPEVAEIYYDKGMIRIDQGKNTSVIYELSTGKMQMINHLDKSYMSQTLEDLAAMRDKMLKQLRGQLAQMPPNVRAELEPKLEQMEKGTFEDVKPKATGKKSKVGKYSCEIYSWSSSGGEGEVCLAKDVGVNLSEFAVYAQKLSDRMKELKLASPQGAGSLAMLEMAKTGFPVRTRNKIHLGADQTVESISEVEEIRTQNVPADKFTVPKDYSLKEMPSMPLAPPPEHGLTPKK